MLEAQKKLQELKNEVARLTSRIDVLQSVANEGTDASRWLMEHKADLVGGLLSERIEAAPEYAAQVEAALGDLMDAVVVASDDAAIAAVDAMKGENVGKAVMALVGARVLPYAGTLEGNGRRVASMELRDSRTNPDCRLARRAAFPLLLS